LQGDRSLALPSQASNTTAIKGKEKKAKALNKSKEHGDKEKRRQTGDYVDPFQHLVFVISSS